MNYKRIIETVLLACDAPVSISRIKQIIGDLDINDKDIIEIIEKLNKEYKQNKKGIYVDSISNGYQIRTLPEFHKYIRIANNNYPKYRLSKPALEVLSIISFKQPISKSDIESIRGVDCSGLIKKLLEAKIIKIKGRDKKMGKALLYSTTSLFLEIFGLNNITDLPKISEIKELIK
jgi:segregation and condensation protein B